MRDFFKWFLLIYLVGMNLLGFILMALDKKRAKLKMWRIKERAMFLISLLGGSIGSLLGMHICRHKTKHWYFRWGMPAILILQIALTVLIVLLVR